MVCDVECLGIEPRASSSEPGCFTIELTLLSKKKAKKESYI